MLFATRVWDARNQPGHFLAPGNAQSPALCYHGEAMDARHTNGTTTKAVAQIRAFGQGQGVSSTNLAQNENPAFVIVRK